MKLKLNCGITIPKPTRASFSYYSVADLTEQFIFQFCCSRQQMASITYGLSLGYRKLVVLKTGKSMLYELYPTRKAAQKQIDFINN